MVLVRLFEHRLEVRDLQTQALLRTHARVDRPGTVVLPDEERIFNPSRETRRILSQAKEIGPAAHQLCETLFAREGRVGQRKLWGIVGLTRRFPRRLIDTACERAMHEGVYSYKRILALTERLMTEALKAAGRAPASRTAPDPGPPPDPPWRRLRRPVHPGRAAKRPTAVYQ